MERNPGKNSGGEEKQNVSQGKDEHGSAPANKRSKGGDNPTVRERNEVKQVVPVVV